MEQKATTAALGDILHAVVTRKGELELQAGELQENAVAAAGSFSTLIVDELNEEVKQVYETQKLLERESQLLKRELLTFTKQLSSWSTKTQQLLGALKNITQPAFSYLCPKELPDSWHCYSSSSVPCQPLLQRCRPLARVRGQFMADLAALLSGLRNTVMLDYSPGVTPQQLRDVVGVLSQLMHKENQAASDTQVKKLHQQLQPLITALQQQLDKQQGVNVPERLTDTGKSTITTRKYSGSMFSLADWDVLDLSGFAGLPVMPTLNGILLGYPVVYWVQQYEEAVAASRELSMSRLQLYKITGIRWSVEAVGPQAVSL
eukprot:gene5467-5702_t